jgi:hypothetical protein
MKPRKRIERRVRPKARGRSRFPKRRDPKYIAWIKERDCLNCGKRPVDPAHIKTRGAGGDDRKNVVPLCRSCHASQEGRTKEFEMETGLDLRLCAEWLTGQYVAAHPELGAA